MKVWYKVWYSCSWYTISQLRSVTCHMGSHSVTCHPTQVSTPRQAGCAHLCRGRPSPRPVRPVLDLPTPEGWKAELTLVTCYIPRWFTRPQTVTHPSTNRARCRLTSLIKPTPLTTTPRRHHEHLPGR